MPNRTAKPKPSRSKAASVARPARKAATTRRHQSTAKPIRISLTIDVNTQISPFEKSNVASLREWRGTLNDLLHQAVSEAVQASGGTIPYEQALKRLVLDGVRIEAQRYLAQRTTLKERADTTATLSGLAGTADPRIANAWIELEKLAKETGKPFEPTPAKLNRLAMTTFSTAERWMKTHHPKEYAQYQARRNARRNDLPSA